MQSVLEKFKAQNFHIVTINVVASQQTGAVKIMSNYGFTALKNPGGDFAWATKNYGVQGTPTSFLLDASGNILFKFNGLESLDAEKTCDQEVAGALKWAVLNETARPAVTAKAQP